ncbi:MAG: hypothetical protein WD645_07120 [Dehalococcoidia bacterium]
MAIMCLLIVLVGAGRGDHVSDLRMAVNSYEHDLLRWQVSHFMDKWVHLALRPIRGAPTADERGEAIAEFFQVGEDLRRLRGDLERTLAVDGEVSTEAGEVQAAIDLLELRREALQPVVLEALQSGISQVVDDMGIIDHVGPVRWPPVNFTFVPNSLVLVRSPRDTIVRLDDFVLRPDMSLLQQVALEDELEADGETAALVVGVGGMATYPAQVKPSESLHTTLFSAAHEWLHHWMFFRPLGKRWWDGGELTVINETVADIAGEEVGDRAYELLTGESVHRAPWQPPSLRPHEEPRPGVFDFTREMRQTRVQLEAMLAADQVAEAEAYLEARREEFVAHGWNIRKLNTAWFAFFGTYASGPGSISPIEEQLRTLRADSASLQEFLERVSVIKRPGQLEEMSRSAGWLPLLAEARGA